MQSICNTLSDVTINYPTDRIFPIDKTLFIDIETTGFSAKTSKLYLIGCVFFKDNTWQTIQFFAEKYSDEAVIIREFFEFAADFTHIVHFNGNNFDIPYIEEKCKDFSFDYNFSRFTGLDIYKRISPYKTFLKLENCKQKTIENFLGINREDKYTGGDLIGLYHSYVTGQDEEIKRLLLLHNFEDIKGMLEILPILAYTDLFTVPVTVTKASANYYTDDEGKERSEVLMAFDLPTALPVPISFLYDKCYFTGAAGQGMLRVPLVEDELKYFYAGYKDYYYLPDEDISLHKSVAQYVDRAHRCPATAETCYTRKVSKFLPEWEASFTPFFKKEYSSKELYLELTDERRTDRKFFSEYVAHVLNHMVV